MPLESVAVRVVRPVRTRTATAGKTTTEAEIDGSPFLARVYRVAETAVDRDEAAPATATLDRMQRLSVPDPACPIRVGDIALLPQPGGGTRRAKVLRPRPYGGRVQYDLELGVEGDAPPTALTLPVSLDVAESSSPDVGDVMAPADVAESSSPDVAA